MKKILLLATNKLPIPPVKGGSIQDLIWNGLIEPNEKADEPVNFSVLSIFDSEAAQIAEGCKNTDFEFMKYPPISYFSTGFSPKLLNI